jgi:hypothetical protein
LVSSAAPEVLAWAEWAGRPDGCLFHRKPSCKCVMWWLCLEEVNREPWRVPCRGCRSSWRRGGTRKAVEIRCGVRGEVCTINRATDQDTLVYTMMSTISIVPAAQIRTTSRNSSSSELCSWSSDHQTPLRFALGGFHFYPAIW